MSGLLAFQGIPFDSEKKLTRVEQELAKIGVTPFRRRDVASYKRKQAWRQAAKFGLLGQILSVVYMPIKMAVRAVIYLINFISLCSGMLLIAALWSLASSACKFLGWGTLDSRSVVLNAILVPVAWGLTYGACTVADHVQYIWNESWRFKRMEWQRRNNWLESDVPPVILARAQLIHESVSGVELWIDRLADDPFGVAVDVWTRQEYYFAVWGEGEFKCV